MCSGNQITPRGKAGCQGSCAGNASPKKPDLSLTEQHEACHGEAPEQTGASVSKS